MRVSEIAWCGGFFEGEGYVGAGISYRSKAKKYKSRAKYHTYCRSYVNQKYKDVLIRFKKHIGFGKVAGPYKTRGKCKRCPLYVWRVTSKANVAKLFKLLKPYLSVRRKQQFRQALKGEYN